MMSKDAIVIMGKVTYAKIKGDTFVKVKDVVSAMKSHALRVRYEVVDSASLIESLADWLAAYDVIDEKEKQP